MEPSIRSSTIIFVDAWLRSSRVPKFKAADGLYLLGPLIWGEENSVLFLGFPSGHIGFSGVGVQKNRKQLVLFEPRDFLASDNHR